MLTGSKPASRSITIVSLVVSILSLMFGLFGVEIAPEDTRALAEALCVLVSVAAQLVAIWGRYRATSRIRSAPPPATLGLVAVLAAFALLPGCATTRPAVAAPAMRMALADDKALYALEVSFRIAVVAASEAASSGALEGDRAAHAKALLTGAWEALRLARAAHAVGDSEGFGERTAAVLTLVGRVHALADAK